MVLTGNMPFSRHPLLLLIHRFFHRLKEHQSGCNTLLPTVLSNSADCRKGNLFLVTAAASSVGLAAIQIAKLVGAISIATTRNQSKAKALADAGADFVINTETEDLVD